MLLKRRLAGIFSIVLSLFALSGCGSDGGGAAQVQGTKVIKESEHRSQAEEAGTSVASLVKTDDEGGYHESGDDAAETEVQPEAKPLDVSALETTVWYPYWDNATADEELALIGDGCDTVCFFASYYDKNNVPFIPDDITRACKRLSDSGQLTGKKTYLTFVNDKLLDKGSSLKDTTLLYSLFGTGEKAEQHAKDCIQLTKSLGCEGIEIDYEAIKKDAELWKCFNSFTHILAEQARAEGMPLRIVFEPSAPIGSYDWPSYPEYVMMCYNLYGFGTEPGPKADVTFVREMAEKMKALPGEINLAFANGGFDFAGDGSVKQINLSNITQILNDTKITPSRDESSGALFFVYTDGSGLSHEIWYADQETMQLWMETAQNCGIDRVSVWRLGGNF